MDSTPATSFSSQDDMRGRFASQLDQTPTLPSSSGTETDDSDSQSSQFRSDTSDNDSDEVFNAIWAWYCALSISESYKESHPTFNLGSQQVYEQLLGRIAAHPGLWATVQDKLRWDWDAVDGVLTLRMLHTGIHETVQELYRDAMTEELNRIAVRFPELQPFRQKLRPKGHHCVTIGPSVESAEYVKSPDGQLHYRGARHPSFLFEVAYTESEAELAEKLDRLYELLQGAVGTIVVINIKYARPAVRLDPNFRHSASITTWTARQVDNTCRVSKSHQPFRESSGNPLAGQWELPFMMLLPLSERCNVSEFPDAAVQISFAALADMVQEGEECERVISEPEPPSGLEFVREYTPPSRDADPEDPLSPSPPPKRRRLAAALPVRNTRSRTRSSSGLRRSPRFAETDTSKG